MSHFSGIKRQGKGTTESAIVLLRSSARKLHVMAQGHVALQHNLCCCGTTKKVVLLWHYSTTVVPLSHAGIIMI